MTKRREMGFSAKGLVVLAAVATLPFHWSCRPASAPHEAPREATHRGGAEAVARTLVEELSQARWDHPSTEFDAAMTEALPEPRVEAIWKGLESAAGPFRSVEDAQIATKDGLFVVALTLRFERMRKVLRVVLDGQRRVVGLFYEPVFKDLAALAEHFIDELGRASFATAGEVFAESLKTSLPPAKLERVWKSVEDQVGRCQGFDQAELKAEGGLWSLLAIARFDRGSRLLKFVFDANNQLAGFFVLPAPVAWLAPSYADPRHFEESQISVGTSPSLPGTLSLPRGAGSVPGVVLIHGSGPLDRDESVGGVKLFKDLAWGLATRGIAVLRYDKRTLHDARGITTSKEEVLDAAHEAIELLRDHAGIDANRIYILGHSQGGYLAPRIVEANPGVAGAIVLGGPTRPLEDSLVDQFAYLASLDPANAALKSGVEAARSFKQAVESPKLSSVQELPVPGAGKIGGAYFLDLRGYEPGALARRAPCRWFVISGGRDYQVTAADFAGWQKALLGKEGTTLKLYPALNHLFVAEDGRPSPEEYVRTNHVDSTVIDDIATWMLAALPTRSSAAP